MTQVLVIIREWKKAAEAATNPRAYSAARPKPQESRRLAGSPDEAVSDVRAEAPDYVDASSSHHG
jgi:hypothetical protein